MLSKVEIIIFYFAGSELTKYSVWDFFVKIFPIFSIFLVEFTKQLVSVLLKSLNFFIYPGFFM